MPDPKGVLYQQEEEARRRAGLNATANVIDRVLEILQQIDLKSAQHAVIGVENFKAKHNSLLSELSRLSSPLSQNPAATVSTGNRAAGGPNVLPHPDLPSLGGMAPKNLSPHWGTEPGQVQAEEVNIQELQNELKAALKAAPRPGSSKPKLEEKPELTFAQRAVLEAAPKLQALCELTPPELVPVYTPKSLPKPTPFG